MAHASKVAVLIPAAMRRRILSPEAEQQLASFAQVVSVECGQIDTADLPVLLDEASACLTGWGTPPLSDRLLASCPRLQLVAHTAGSVRHLVPGTALERGVHVSHAAAIIADAVAEFVIAQALLCMRSLHRIDQAMHQGTPWATIRETYPGRLLGNQVVGVVGTGRVGRAVIHLLTSFGCRVLASDPYLTDTDAMLLGVESVDLDDLFRRADVVTLHAPVLPETMGMVTRQHLAALHNGAVFINAARASLVNEQALLQEVQRGRIIAALDVFSEEPLPPDSRMRDITDLLLSPHTAGQTVDTYLRQGQAMVEEVQRFLAGEPLCYEIPPAMFSIFA